MLDDKARYGLTIGILATKVMPAIMPMLVNDELGDEDFVYVSELLQEMLDHVRKGQRSKLKLEVRADERYDAVRT